MGPSPWSIFGASPFSLTAILTWHLPGECGGRANPRYPKFAGRLRASRRQRCTCAQCSETINQTPSAEALLGPDAQWLVARASVLVVVTHANIDERGEPGPNDYIFTDPTGQPLSQEWLH